jgi:LAS superfamily LD-carboxypeptidase LdcB
VRQARRAIVGIAAATVVIAAVVIAAGCAPLRPADGPGGNGRLPLDTLEAVRPDCWVAQSIAEPLRRMLAAANADGVALAPEGYFSHDPIAVSGCYRSYDEQVVARDYFCGKGACDAAAEPGTSRHGLGHAVDFRDDAGELTFDAKGYAWLVDHASEFGFFHPDWAEPDGRNPEPWHWEHD